MTIRTLLFVALFLTATGARAQSFLELAHATALRTTTGATQFAAVGTQLVVAQLRLRLDEGQRAFITYTVEGSDSTLRGQFFGPGGSSMIDSFAASGTLITAPALEGLLDYSFRSVGSNLLVQNGSNFGWNPGQFGVILDAGLLSGRLMFEDGRLRPDFDYDDLVIRFQVNVVPVPEAGTVVMMLAGLGVLGFFGMRRRIARR